MNDGTIGLLLATTEPASQGALISDPAGVLSVLLMVLAGVFAIGRHPVLGKVFRVVPALLFCYFIPTTLTTLEILPQHSPTYSWIKSVLLPVSLLLLILALDVPAILRLGPKALIMLLAGTLGVVIGGPIALWVTHAWLPDDAWRGMATLAGSWIGGGANMLALKEIAEPEAGLYSAIIVVDVFVASVWMAVLLYSAGMQKRIDKFTGADNSAITALRDRASEYQKRTQRIPELHHLIWILALGFGGSWLASGAAVHVGEWCAANAAWLSGVLSPTSWKFILITTLGVALSFTPVRRLDGAGASRIGSVFIYLLVTSIGAEADFGGIVEHKALIVMGAIWMLVHIVVLLSVARLIRAPMFFVAVGSQANIGGAASAPVVAGAFHPSLAPVGALLAVAGYVLGTYCALMCMKLMEWVAGAN